MRSIRYKRHFQNEIWSNLIQQDSWVKVRKTGLAYRTDIQKPNLIFHPRHASSQNLEIILNLISRGKRRRMGVIFLVEEAKGELEVFHCPSSPFYSFPRQRNCKGKGGEERITSQWIRFPCTLYYVLYIFYTYLKHST